MKMRNKEMMITIAALAMLAGTPAIAMAEEEDHSFQTDNGVYELEYSVHNREAMIGNYYTAPADETLTIDRVEIALGFGQGGLPFELLIYDDPDNDGDPTNAVLVSTTTGSILPGDEDDRTLRIQELLIDPVDVEDGFFVAVRLADQPYDPHGNNLGVYSTAPSAYRLDYNAPTTNWRITGLPDNGPSGGITDIDTADLTNNFVSSVQLNFVIRAYGTTGGDNAVMVADMNGDGVHDMFDISMFLGLFMQGDADFNGDGATNFFDLGAFIDAWRN